MKLIILSSIALIFTFFNNERIDAALSIYNDINPIITIINEAEEVYIKPEKPYDPSYVRQLSQEQKDDFAAWLASLKYESIAPHSDFNYRFVIRNKDDTALTAISVSKDGYLFFNNNAGHSYCFSTDNLSFLDQLYNESIIIDTVSVEEAFALFLKSFNIEPVSTEIRYDKSTPYIIMEQGYDYYDIDHESKHFYTRELHCCGYFFDDIGTSWTFYFEDYYYEDDGQTLFYFDGCDTGWIDYIKHEIGRRYN